ncbi:MAG: glycosyltransferase, partial [Acetobacteraceae bacterium]|nr:glycosyltransferase [Acetobacteraceae bacterium]
AESRPSQHPPPPATGGREKVHCTPAVVIPVHGGGQMVLDCLHSVFDSVPAETSIIVVDDASPDPGLAEALRGLAREGRIRLLRHERNLGFPAAANAGLAECRGRDVVLLNSDTLVPPRWLERLRAAAHSAPDIGTVTPLSNNASVLSYPAAAGEDPAPDLAGTVRLDALARRANSSTTIEIPAGVGFCMYIRRECLDATGLFRDDVFAQGYGEENDFCLRARHLGWRHVAAPGVFVSHRGGASFQQATRLLQERNDKLLNRMHPGYRALVEEFIKADPLGEARRRLDLARWRADGRRGQQSIILVSHAEGGGVERRLALAAGEYASRGLRSVVLRPRRLADGSPAVVVGEGVDGGYPNLTYKLPAESAALLGLLRAALPLRIEVHHLLGHSPELYRLLSKVAAPYDVHVHDYAWFCPRVSLVGAERRYCGEPELAQCETCITDAGSLIEENISVQALRDRSAAFLARANRVVAPSQDTAARLRRYFPELRPEVVPHEDDAAITAPATPTARNGICRVCVTGAIGLHKGYDILLDCARDAADRDLPIEFVVVGHTIDDDRLLATGRVFITGPFEPDEAAELIRAQAASLGFLPSITPETWCMGLTELWRAGLHVAAFDCGAPAERIRNTGWGLLLPLGLPPARINKVIVAAAGLTSHEGDGMSYAAIAAA